jgi:hypothetical protein
MEGTGKRRLGRLLPVSFVLGALGALAFAVPASANTDVVACQVNGTAHTNPDVRLVSGAGSYTFSSGDPTGALHLLCVGADEGNASTRVVAPGASPTHGGVFGVETDSVGTYKNTVCGTGIARSTSNGPAKVDFGTDTQLGNDLVAAIPGSNYTIQFIGGQGVLLFGGGSSIQGGGAVSIAAGLDSTEPGGCTDSFTVAGSLVGTFSGPA